MRFSNIVPLLLVLVSVPACGAGAPERLESLGADARPLRQAMDRVTRVMVDEVTSPPVAARTYAYASIAAYEAARHDRPDRRTLAGQLSGLEALPEPEPDVVGPVAAVAALLTVAESLVYDETAVAEYRDSLLDAFTDRGVPRRGVRASAAYGAEVAAHVLAWAGTDGLKEARARPRYRVEQDDPSRWQPTPPAYMDGLEPNWEMLRPFVLQTAAEFRPPPPVRYDTTPGSPFHREVRAVYDAVKDATEEEIEIAKFWDCNPYALQAEGHFMFSMKKITPGGHWMGITGVAIEESDAGVVEAAEAYALVGIALADGFLSVWEEKYRSELVRPETVINRGMDPEWRPILQTPPFPEYTSGHSVVSGAAAEVLTMLFGEDFEYHDDVEVPYGLPVRWYASFREAAEEAAISRLYGGIHYPMAVEHGLTQGRAVGNAVIQRVRTGTRVADATH